MFYIGVFRCGGVRHREKYLIILVSQSSGLFYVVTGRYLCFASTDLAIEAAVVANNGKRDMAITIDGARPRTFYSHVKNL